MAEDISIYFFQPKFLNQKINSLIFPSWLSLELSLDMLQPLRGKLESLD